MHRFFNAILILLMSGFVIAMFSGSATKQDENMPMLQPDDSLLWMIQKGKKLYQSKCGTCHFLYKPGKYSKELWISSMPEMSGRTNLNKEETELILEYLVKNAKR